MKNHLITYNANNLLSDSQRELIQKGDVLLHDLQNENTATNVLSKIRNYPIGKIQRQIEICATDKNLESVSITTFIEQNWQILYSIVVNLIEQKNASTNEAYFLDKMQQLNLNYLIKNRSLQILYPEKYVDYLKLVQKSTNAFHADLMDFISEQSSCCEAINNYFKALNDNLENEAKIDLINFQKDIHSTTSEIGKFPTNIFLDYEAFTIFEKSVKQAITKDDIGFLFRYYSENCKPPKIVAKETAFRNWYNEDKKYTIELNSPIKTYNQINGKDKKIRMIPVEYQQ